MNALNNMKTGTKLIGGFALMALIAGVVGYIGIQNIQAIDAADTRLYQNMTVPIAEVSEMSTNFQRIRVNLRDMILAEDAVEIAGYEATINDLMDENDALADQFKGRILSEEMSAAFDEFLKARSDFRAPMQKVIDLAKAGKKEDALTEMRGNAFVAAKAEMDAIEKLLTMKLADAEATSNENTLAATTATTTMIVSIALAVILALAIGIIISQSITAPLAKGVQMMQEMGKGHLGLRLKLDRRDEIGVLAAAMDRFAEDLQTIVIGTMKQIAAGDLSADVTAKDAQDEIAPALRNTILSLRNMRDEAGRLSKAAVEGKLATRADASQYQGAYRDIVQGVNNTLDSVIGPLNVAAAYVDRISKGDIPAKITDAYNGDFNTIKNNLNQCIDAVNLLVADAGMLSKAAVEGKLATRADAGKHWGDFRKIVQGVNDTLDAVIGPLNVAAKYVDEISKGNIPPKITDTYNGDFNTIKGNLNICIDSLNGLIGEMNTMSAQHDAGDIDVKIPADKFYGAYRTMAEGVNNMVGGHIQVKKKAMACVAEFGKGNFEAPLERFPGKKAFINDTIEQVRANLKALIADANMLSKAAVEGKLATRADAGRHEGDFRKIVQGVNDTLDAVIGPLNVAAAYVDRISKGEIPPEITDNYNGDFNQIKNNLNAMLGYLSEMASAADQIAQNNLTVTVSPRSEKDVLGRSFVQMIQGLNATMLQTSQVVTQVTQSVEQVRSVSQDLSSNAQEQSASVEEVTANLQETDSQVKSSADNARITDQLVNETTNLAGTGQEKMKAMTESMAAINHSSQEIAKIIKVIDDIAFQTNLLALNAAVEAARAGQHGRGFAVVAQEVRNLAERSAKAAKSTAELIEDSTRRVQEGVKITDETAGSLKEIVQNVVKVKDLVGEIAAASDEQTKALGQINKAMNQVNQGTQSNSSQSEELASTADELGGLAARLSEEVARFQLRRVDGFQRMADLGASPVDLNTLPVAGIAAAAVSGRAPKHNGGKGRPDDGSLDRDARGYGKF